MRDKRPYESPRSRSSARPDPERSAAQLAQPSDHPQGRKTPLQDLARRRAQTSSEDGRRRLPPLFFSMLPVRDCPARRSNERQSCSSNHPSGKALRRKGEFPDRARTPRRPALKSAAVQPKRLLRRFFPPASALFAATLAVPATRLRLPGTQPPATTPRAHCQDCPLPQSRCSAFSRASAASRQNNSASLRRKATHAT